MIQGALRDGRRRVATARSTRFAFICQKPSAWHSRGFTTTAATEAEADTAQPWGGEDHIGQDFRRVDSAALSKGLAHQRIKRFKPEWILRQEEEERQDAQRIREATWRAEDADRREAKRIREADWLERLNALLPPHLQATPKPDLNEGSEAHILPFQLADLVAEVDRKYLSIGFFQWLAVDQDRWRAAVWIVKTLVDFFHQQSWRTKRLDRVVQEWQLEGRLDDILQDPVYLVPKDGNAPNTHITRAVESLDDLTDDKPSGYTSDEILRHDVLGIVWRGIGKLLLSCSNDHTIADGEAKPEILEMIALMHHYGLMPHSVYDYTPPQNEDAIQQPPTLNLLSSRIYTALSDAQWKGRQAEAVQNVKSDRDRKTRHRLEALSSSYRVSVSGVKLEIWIELILWSCLHGGWIMQGSSLLMSMARNTYYRAREPQMWTSLSWRDALKSIMPAGQSDALDWDQIRYLFDTRSSASMDGVDVTSLRLDRTVSSEVINAYIDAIVTEVSVGVGNRGISLAFTIRTITTLRHLLQRSHLNLGGGTWDAMLVRLLDSGSFDIARAPQIVRELAQISPPLGEELQSSQSQALPKYVLDGSAVLISTLHRALHARIKDSDFEGAIETLGLLQERIDKDKHTAIVDFFERAAAPGAKHFDRDAFSDNFAGIDHPSFNTQLPPEILAGLLELAVESRAFRFAKWMLKSEDVDGPLIPGRIYRDPTIATALVRYATAIEDTQLLTQVVELQRENEDGSPSLPPEMLQAFLDSQIQLRRWTSAKFIMNTPGLEWNVTNAAIAAKTMILETHDATRATPGQLHDFTAAQSLLKELLAVNTVSGHLDAYASFHDMRVKSLQVVLSAIDQRWADFCDTILPWPKHFIWQLSNRAFYHILDAVVRVYGSTAGRNLVDQFEVWSESKQQEVVSTQPGSDEIKEPAPMPRSLEEAIERDQLPKNRVYTHVPSRPNRPVLLPTMYGGLMPTTPCFTIVIEGAVTELEGGGLSAEERFTRVTNLVWAFRWLRRLGKFRAGGFEGAGRRLDGETFSQIKETLLLAGFSEEELRVEPEQEMAEEEEEEEEEGPRVPCL